MSEFWNRILITGGAGFIGSHILDRLIQERYTLGWQQIIMLDNFTRGHRENVVAERHEDLVTIVDGDIRDQHVVQEVMRGVDLVFHQAAIRITQCAEAPRLALDVLATGTFNVLEAAAQAGVRKIVAASSASVYGMAETFPTDEQHHPYNNRTLYGAAKMFNEGLLRSFHDMYGLNYVALRYFNVYGPRMDVYGAYTEVLIRWMERIAAGQPPIIFGNGSESMDFVYVEDVARANILAAKAPVGDEVFNVASGVETSLTALAQILGRIMGAAGQPDYGPARKVNAVPRRLAAINKGKRLLGFEPQVPLEEGLRRLVAWWQAQRLRADGEASVPGGL